MRIPISRNLDLEVSESTDPWRGDRVYVPSLATLSPDQIAAAREYVRTSKLYLDNVDFQSLSQKHYAAVLDAVANDLSRASQ